jgi:hypothetical protein
MGDPQPLERQSRVSAGERLNVFALVIYIPGPLGAFLDDLRRELVPQCKPHAHISVLPPRPLTGGWQEAASRSRALARTWRPFEIELTCIDVFPLTDVVYIEIGEGNSELHRLHAAMNSGPMEFEDPFPYHPHVTLAQELPHQQVAAVGELARRRWREFRGSRRMLADHAVFVQNTLSDRWIDLADYALGKNSR